MLDLAELRRKGPLSVEADIPADDPVWEGVGGRPIGPLRVQLRGMLTGTGQLLVRGSMEGELGYACRRCLDPVSQPFRESLDLVWSEGEALDPWDDPVGEAGEDEIRILESGVREVALGEAVRQEILLRAPRFMTCRPTCAGLCPRCGANRNVDACTCSREEADPRWDALRGLTFDQDS